MRKTGEKSIGEELQQEGLTPVSPVKFKPSDKGEFAEQLVNEISVEEMLKKTKQLNPRYKKLIKKRFFEENTLEEISKETPNVPEDKVGISRGRVGQMEDSALRKLQKFLPKSLERQLRLKDEREISKKLINEYLYPNDKNRFLMIEYLVDYLSKNVSRFLKRKIQLCML